MRILVLGGSGLLGKPTTHRLADDGYDVRLFARDPARVGAVFGQGFDIAGGDITDTASLEAAMQGCDGVHVSVGGPVDRMSAEKVAALAPRLGIRRITYLSGSTVAEENRWFPMVAQKLDAEQALAAGEVPFTIFRPTWPMEQLPRFVQGGNALVIGDRLPALHWIAAGDLARMVSHAFADAATANRTFFAHGPEPWTMVEALEQYCATFHPEISGVSVMGVDAARAQAAASGNQMLGFMADMMGYFDTAGELGSSDEADRVFGPALTTLGSWLAARKE